MTQLKTKLERDLFDLAEVLGVGTKNSDICLRAIKKIQELEGDVTDLTAKNTDMGWQLNPDRMGGQFTREEIERKWHGWR
jgi:hypothetical protein